MLELQRLSGFTGNYSIIIGIYIYILRNIIYYTINWEPKRQKKKLGMAELGMFPQRGFVVKFLPGAEAETLSTGPGRGLVSGARSPGMPWLCGILW